MQGWGTGVDNRTHNEVQETATGGFVAASLMTKYDHNLQIEWTHRP